KATRLLRAVSEAEGEAEEMVVVWEEVVVAGFLACRTSRPPIGISALQIAANRIISFSSHNWAVRKPAEAAAKELVPARRRPGPLSARSQLTRLMRCSKAPSSQIRGQITAAGPEGWSSLAQC